MPDRLRRLVFVACAVPPPGVSVIEVLGSLSPTLADLAAQLGDGVVDEDGTLHPDFATAMMCNDMNDEQRAFTLSGLVPEVLNVTSEPANLEGLRLPIPRTYIRLRQDQSLVYEAQTRMAKHLGDDAQILDIDAGHMVMVSQPAALAQILNAY